MVVANLDVIRIAVDEPEADAPLSVHRDGVLPQSVILERIQAIAPRHLQVIHADLQVDVFQLANGAPGDVGLVQRLAVPVVNRSRVCLSATS